MRESMLPGNDLRAKASEVAALGFQGLEIDGLARDLAPSAIRDALGKAGIAASGVKGSFYLADPDPKVRQETIEDCKRLIALAQAIGAGGVLEIPFTRSGPVPDLSPYKSASDLVRELFVVQLSAMAPIAQAAGVVIWIKAPNRYESPYLNLLSEAVELCRQVNHPAVKVTPDFFHMNIEEADLAAALAAAAGLVDYVYLADSNRQLPGLGHTDFRRALAPLKRAGYDGWLTLECRLPTDRQPALARFVEFITSIWNQI